MVLNKRERTIAIGAGGAVGLLLVYFVILSPYFSARDDAQTSIDQANQGLNAYKQLLALQPEYQSKWDEMRDEGIEEEESVAESQLHYAVNTWTQAQQITLQSTNPAHATSQGKFQRIDWTFQFDTQGVRGLQQMAMLYWSIESAPIPIRINDVIIKSVREGTDQLTVTLTISALCKPPSADSATPGNTNTAPPAPAGDNS